jgi:hypothetical protein
MTMEPSANEHFSEPTGRVRMRALLADLRHRGLGQDARAMALFEAMALSLHAVTSALDLGLEGAELDQSLKEAASVGASKQDREKDESYGGLPYERQCSALGLAAYFDLQAEAEALLKRGADPNAGPERRSAVACAVHAGSAPCLKILLDAGADALDQVDGRESLLFRVAARVATLNMVDCLKLLAERPHASPELSNDEGFKRLMERARAKEFKALFQAERARRVQAQLQNASCFGAARACATRL